PKPPVYRKQKGGGPKPAAPFANAPPRVVSTSASWSRSEIELRAELEEARLQDVGRPEPLARRQRRERVGDRKRPAAVEEVVGVEVDPEAIAIQLEALRGAQVELVEVEVAVVLANLHEVPDPRGGVGRVRMPECRRRCRGGPLCEDARRRAAGLHA